MTKRSPRWRHRLLAPTAVLLVLCLSLLACDDEDGQTTPSAEPKPPPRETPVIDLGLLDTLGQYHKEDSRVRLGMKLGRARPPLTRGCKQDHYAERLSHRFVRLTCTTRTLHLDEPRTSLRLGFLEYRDSETRLATYAVRIFGTSPELESLREQIRAEVENRIGSPPSATGPRLTWQGVGREGGPTLAELEGGGADVGYLEFRFQALDLTPLVHAPFQ